MVGREEQYKACLQSVTSQTYQFTNIITHYDHNGEGQEFPFAYNLFCNELKESVEGGWFFFLDDDDTLLHNKTLEQLATHLTDPSKAVIVQMLRNGRPKPSRPEYIKKDFIGLPCIVTHSSHKHIGKIAAKNSGDWDYINDVITAIGYKYVPMVVVNTPKRSYGK